MMSLLERIGPRNFGFLGMAAVVAMGVIVGVISLVPFGQTRYVAELRHTAGLRVGDEVQIAGVGVGEVRGIRLAGRRVETDFSVDEDVRLGRSTNAAVKVGTLLGTHYLEIVPAGSGSLAGGRIPLTRTSVAYNLQDVLEGSSNTLNQLDAEAVGTSLTTVAEALDYSPEKSRAAIDGIARLSRVAAEESDRLRTLLASSKDVTALLVANSDELIDLMKKSTLVMEELTERRKLIRQILSDSRRLATTVSGVLDENKAELDPLMRDFTVAAHNLRTQEKQITASIDGLATISHYLANAGGDGPYLGVHLPVPFSDPQICLTGGCS